LKDGIVFPTKGFTETALVTTMRCLPGHGREALKSRRAETWLRQAILFLRGSGMRSRERGGQAVRPRQGVSGEGRPMSPRARGGHESDIAFETAVAAVFPERRSGSMEDMARLLKSTERLARRIQARERSVTSGENELSGNIEGRITFAFSESSTPCADMQEIRRKDPRRRAPGSRIRRKPSRFRRRPEFGSARGNSSHMRADSLRMRLAFDAVNAFGVWRRCHFARIRPDDLALGHVPAGQAGGNGTLGSACQAATGSQVAGRYTPRIHPKTGGYRT